MIIYQALTRLFSTGRFSAFDKNTFDYLKTLSVSHLWLTGVIKHSRGESYVKGNAGSPYSIVDYYDVNDYLADNPSNRLKEFKLLLGRAHRNEIKILIDFVPNHVSPDYHDSRGGLKTLGIHDYDWTDTDKIDYSDRDNWTKLLNIIRFWAKMGVDGFRCDMAELVPLDFWRYLICNAKSEFPDLLFIAESYDKYSYSGYLDAGFDYMYDKSGLYDVLRAVSCDGASASLITANWQFLGDRQSRMLNFLENHDEQRLASNYFAGSPEKAYAALAVSALFYPTPFMLYFGQEIGENAFDGAEGRTSIFDFARHICPCAKLGDNQKKVLDRYRQIMLLKNEYEDCSNFDLCYCQRADSGFNRDKHFAFLRGNNLLVVCNFSSSMAQMELIIPSEAHSIIPSGVKVSIAPFDFTIIRK